MARRANNAAKVNTARAQVRQVIEAYDKEKASAVVTVIADTVGFIRELTPVKTGGLRASVHVIPGDERPDNKRERMAGIDNAFRPFGKVAALKSEMDAKTMATLGAARAKTGSMSIRITSSAWRAIFTEKGARGRPGVKMFQKGRVFLMRGLRNLGLRRNRAGGYGEANLG